MKYMKYSILISALIVLIQAQVAFSAFINWTDWQSVTEFTAVDGVIDNTGVGVHYTGLYSFVELGTGTNDYWVEYSPPPYTGNAIIDNRPTAYELIALDLQVPSTGMVTQHQIHFDNPVSNPVMAIVSLGRLDRPVTYAFDQAFNVLSEGNGYWGDGSYTLVANSLTGNELHGALQFPGLVSDITWTSTPNEYWHGVTVGVPVPEPATMLLFGVGIAGLAGMRLRRKKK